MIAVTAPPGVISYPQVIHRIGRVIHRLSTGYPQDIHRAKLSTGRQKLSTGSKCEYAIGYLQGAVPSTIREAK